MFNASDQGRAAKGTLTVLTVQHAHYRPDLGAASLALLTNGTRLAASTVVQSDTGDKALALIPRVRLLQGRTLCQRTWNAWTIFGASSNGANQGDPVE